LANIAHLLNSDHDIIENKCQEYADCEYHFVRQEICRIAIERAMNKLSFVDVISWLYKLDDSFQHVMHMHKHNLSIEATNIEGVELDNPLLYYVSLGTSSDSLVAEWKKEIERIGDDYNKGISRELLSTVEELDAIGSQSAIEGAMDDHSPYWKQALSALRAVALDQCAVDELFQMQFIVLGYLHGSPVKTDFVMYFADLLSKQWMARVQTKALFLSPKVTIPPIIYACGSDKSGYNKAASIMLAVLDGIDKRLTSEDKERLRTIQAAGDI
jgi:hypothetical protein